MAASTPLQPVLFSAFSAFSFENPISTNWFIVPSTVAPDILNELFHLLSRDMMNQSMMKQIPSRAYALRSLMKHFVFIFRLFRVQSTVIVFENNGTFLLHLPLRE